jgi:hypothetical protein
MDSPLASLLRCQETLCCPSRTGHLFSEPVNGERRDVHGARRSRLPAGIDRDRSNEVNRMEVNRISVKTVSDAFGARVARIHQLVGREQVVGRQIGLKGVERVVILLGGCGGGDLGNQVRQVVLTAFGQMRPDAPYSRPTREPASAHSARRGRRGSAATLPPEAAPAACGDARGRWSCASWSCATAAPRSARASGPLAPA